MAIPAAYTEETLSLFMHKTIQAVADVLNWSVAAGSYEEAVNNTLLSVGVDDIGEVQGRAALGALRAVARVEVWRAVLAASAADFDFDADGGRFSRSQIHEMAKTNLALAEADAASYSPTYRVVVDRVIYRNDPYSYRPEDEALP